MPNLWELIPDTTITWDVPYQHNLPSSAGTYGDRIENDLTSPVYSYTFRARGMTLTEVQAVISARSRGTPYVVTDYKGRTYSGTLLSVAYSPIGGTTLYIISIILRV